MSKPRLIYFDLAASRGEECRLALHTAGVDFEDVRVKREEWMAMKPTTPFGSLPIFEVPGHPPLAQSNAILVLIGREHRLHPKDNFEAARHEAMMCHIEDLRAAITPSMRMANEAEKKAVREELAANYLPLWGERAEKQIGDGPFFGGSSIHVVDFKIYLSVRWLTGGHVDHIPSSIFSAFPKLLRVHDSVRDDARVQAWYAKS